MLIFYVPSIGRSPCVDYETINMSNLNPIQSLFRKPALYPLRRLPGIGVAVFNAAFGVRQGLWLVGCACCTAFCHRYNAPPTEHEKDSVVCG
jgi:hypothetical protein